jgi:hypothetical protein
MRVKTYQDWKNFCQGRETVSVRYDRADVYVANHPGLFPVTDGDAVGAWKRWIQHKFRQQGVEVYRFFHSYEKENPADYWGLVMEREDSDINLTKKVTAVIGVNARRIHELAVEEKPIPGPESGREPAGGGCDSDASKGALQDAGASQSPSRGDSTNSTE